MATNRVILCFSLFHYLCSLFSFILSFPFIASCGCAKLCRDIRLSRLTHCHLCFVRIFVPTPAACHTCSCVAYCSRRCRDADAQVHSRECELLPALWYSKASITCFLALRAITQRPFEEIMRLKEGLRDPGSVSKISAENPYRGDDYTNAFYNLGNSRTEYQKKYK